MLSIRLRNPKTIRSSCAQDWLAKFFQALVKLDFGEVQLIQGILGALEKRALFSNPGVAAQLQHLQEIPEDMEAFITSVDA